MIYLPHACCTCGYVFKIEGFWKYYNHLVRPHDLPNTSDYHLFKEGIKPMWEVP